MVNKSASWALLDVTPYRVAPETIRMEQLTNNATVNRETNNSATV